MPAIKPDRVLGDLYKLRTLRHLQDRRAPPDAFGGRYRGARMVRRAMHRGRARDHHRRHRQYSGQEQGGGAKALSGSHLESQNHAGWLDGALGCVYALEAARAIHEAGGDTGVDVVVFCDEEGHFGSFLGSQSFTGLLTEEDIDKAKNKNDGTPLRDALTDAGYAGRPRLEIEPERYEASSRRISSRATRSRSGSCASAS